MAQVDYFLKLEGIEGESPDAKHKGEIAVESFSWGAQQMGTSAHGGGGGAGRVNFHDFHFVKSFDKSSPKLMLACASGEHFPKALFTLRKAGKDQQEYLKWHFKDLIVSSYQTGGSGHGNVVPTDQISLNFAQIEMEYKEQKSDGTLGGQVKAGWNIKENKKV